MEILILLAAELLSVRVLQNKNKKSKQLKKSVSHTLILEARGKNFQDLNLFF